MHIHILCNSSYQFDYWLTNWYHLLRKVSISKDQMLVTFSILIFNVLVARTVIAVLYSFQKQNHSCWNVWRLSNVMKHFHHCHSCYFYSMTDVHLTVNLIFLMTIEGCRKCCNIQPLLTLHWFLCLFWLIVPFFFFDIQFDCTLYWFLMFCPSLLLCWRFVWRSQQGTGSIDLKLQNFWLCGGKQPLDSKKHHFGVQNSHDCLWLCNERHPVSWIDHHPQICAKSNISSPDHTTTS